jgi:hypothetical protein
MLATMEPPGQREQGVQNRMWELVNCRSAPRPGTQAVLRVLQSAEPDRGWRLIKGPLYSVLATREEPPCLYDPGGLRRLRRERGEKLSLGHAACLLLAEATAQDRAAYQVAATTVDALERLAPSVDPPIPAYGSAGHAWVRHLRCFPVVPDAERFMMCDTDPVPLCDGRYRCLVCPGGLGPGGRGFKRVMQRPGAGPPWSSVPCVDPVHHMGVLNIALRQQPGDLPDQVCPATLQRKPNRGDAVDNVADLFGLWSPGIDATILNQLHGTPCFCRRCKFVGQGTHGLASTVGVQRTTELETIGRIRKQRGGTMIPWCDGRWRCTRCDPKGRTRARNVRCKDKVNHVPTYSSSFSGVAMVHFAGGGTNGDNLTPELREIGMRRGCKVCKDTLASVVQEDSTICKQCE